MAYKTRAEIQQSIDFYFNDGVAINSIKPSTTGGEFESVIDSFVHKADIIDNLTTQNSTLVLSAQQGYDLNQRLLALSGSLTPQGNWDALNNVPDITGTTADGFFWIVDTDGATNLGGITDWKINDWAVYTAEGWAKVDNTDKVTSVNGIVGDVELDADDIETFAGSGVTVLDALNDKADSSELGDYLPLTGGTLSGALTLSSNVTNFNSQDNILRALQVGGRFLWRVNGESNSVMTLGTNGQLTLTEQLNANGGIQTTNLSVGSIGFRSVLRGNELDFDRNSTNYFIASSVGGFFSWRVNGSIDIPMTLGTSGQLTLTEQLNANGGVVVDEGNGYTSQLTDNDLIYTRGGANYMKALAVGGYFLWQVNGSADQVMKLATNGQLTLTEQLNADGGVVVDTIESKTEIIGGLFKVTNGTKNAYKFQTDNGNFWFSVDGGDTQPMKLATNGQLTLTEQLNANGGVTVNQENGYYSQLIDNQLLFSRGSANYINVDGVGGYLRWRTNGDSTTRMQLGANGQLTTYEQLNANGGVVITKQGDDVEILKLNSERSWSFYQVGSGAGSTLFLGDNSGGKTFKIGLGANKEIGTQFFTPTQGGYAKLQTWKGSDVNNTEVAYVDSNGIGSFNGGVRFNNEVTTRRYVIEFNSENWSTKQSKSISLGSISSGLDYTKLNVLSCQAFRNGETGSISAMSGRWGCDFEFTPATLLIYNINGTSFSGNSNFTNHKVIVIIEENIA